MNYQHNPEQLPLAGEMYEANKQRIEKALQDNTLPTHDDYNVLFTNDEVAERLKVCFHVLYVAVYELNHYILMFMITFI